MKTIQRVMKKISSMTACYNLTLLLLACIIFPQATLAAVIADGDYLIQMADSDLTVASSGMTAREQITLAQNEQAGIWRFAGFGRGKGGLSPPFCRNFYPVDRFLRVCVE